ncbi:hypothetical protein OGAPHI_004233 [Ogataea philodendri]|uniref:Uncharacterized protein n=1 Tax=Ogataea philodendri TaxID=1378263 RepID=A0A9P8P7F2_9ASCO|nr:uncharacterized protein OGAPHI_004233 [Ogataea philodendri]KAH3666044.1 hypothetical protein OGAPHI_004233 [Ogataea philodendri]
MFSLMVALRSQADCAQYATDSVKPVNGLGIKSSLEVIPGRNTLPLSRSISPSRANNKDVFPDPVGPMMTFSFPVLKLMLRSLNANSLSEFLDQ